MIATVHATTNLVEYLLVRMLGTLDRIQKDT
jgi:hypothetical protein